MRLARIFLVLTMIFSFFLISGSASASTVFSGWVFSDQQVSAIGQTFTLRFATDYTYIFLDTKNSSIAVGRGECVDEATLNICYVDVVYDKEAKQNKINLEMTQKLATMSLTRTIGKTTIQLGEKTNITVRIKNAGEYAAEDIFYEDFLSGFNIHDVLGCEKSGSSVIWRGRLKINETKTCTYYISPNEILDKTIKAKLEYTDSEKRTTYSTGLSLKSTLFIENTLYSENEINLGNTTKLTLNLSTKTNDSQKILIRLYLPNGLLLNRSIDFSKTSGTSGSEPYWNGTISGNMTSLDVYAEGIKSGYNELIFKGEYAYLGKNYTFENKKTMNVKLSDVKLTTSIADSVKFDEETEQWIKVYAQNQNAEAKIKNLKIIVDSPLFSAEPYLIGELNASSSSSSSILVLNLKKLMPHVNSATAYKFNLNYSYETEFGEKRSSTIQRTITVVPIVGLEIVFEPSSSTPKSEDTITITTKLKNARNTKINDINIYDDSKPTTGSNSATLSINASQTQTAYSYTIKLPYVGEETGFNITTKAAYLDAGKEYTYTFVKEIKISKKDLKLSASRTIPELLEGSIFSNTYEISNPLSEEIRSIRLLLKRQPDFDHVDTREYEISRLSPGEKVTFTLDLKAKENGTADYQGENLLFRDIHGTLYEQNLTQTSATIKHAQSASPILRIEKQAPDYLIGEAIQINLTIKNKGIQTAATIIDDSREWQIIIPANGEKKISYNKTFYKNGTTDLGEAEAIYEHQGRAVRSYSKKTSIKSKIKPLATQAAESKVIKTQSPVEDSKQEDEQKDEQKSALAGQTGDSEAPDDADGNQNEEEPAEEGDGLFAKFLALIRFIFK